MPRLVRPTPGRHPGFSALSPPGALPGPRLASARPPALIPNLGLPVASRPALQPRVGLLPAIDQRPPSHNLPGRDPSHRGAWRASRRRRPAVSLAFPSQRAPLWRALLFAAAGPTRHTPPRMPARCRGRLHPGPAATPIPFTGPRHSPHPPSP